MLNLPKSLPLRKRHEIFDSYDCCFWCGDLNFRLEQTREEIIRDIEVRKLVSKGFYRGVELYLYYDYGPFLR